ncbi:MFS general substrate transporter [Hymenopellis radicata]|nr:MFS general substrate transporter [Hymenopellis radicata]
MFKISYPAWYHTPMAQVFMVGFVCFCTVGMFSAINQLGAGGTQDIALSDISNSVLYGVFCIAGFFGGSINNLLGPRLTLFIGTLGYILYIGSLWCFQTQGTRWFLILAGGILGATAALLWSAQGSIMMSYPEEKDKGRAIGMFWGIFQAGSLIGSIMAFAINVKNGGLDAVKTTTYLAIMIVMAFGSCLCFFILAPSEVRRSDGTRVELHSTTTFREEVSGFLSLFKNKQMLLLLPLSFASNFFYTYQSAIAFALLDSSTRALNGIITGVASICGAQILGLVLDIKWLGRRKRGFLGLGVTMTCAVVVWSLGIVYQVGFTRATVFDPKINYKDSAALAKPAALLFFYYINDAFVQSLIYWTMGSLTNDPFTLARYAGFYKAIQSGGAAIAFGVDAVATPYINEIAVNFALLMLALPLCGVVIFSIKEHSDVVVDVVEEYGDEKKASSEGVIVDQS